MPIYEYHCANCDAVFEKMRPMRESSEPASCPNCGRQAGRIMPTSFLALNWNVSRQRQALSPQEAPVRGPAHKETKIPLLASKSASVQKPKRAAQARSTAQRKAVSAGKSAKARRAR